MYKILDNLYQGPTPQKCGIDDYPQAIVNLMEYDEFEFKDNIYKPRIYISLPIKDGSYQSLFWLDTSVDLVLRLIKNYRTYIHCYAGVSRSPMLVAATLMKLNGWRNHEKALNYIAEINPRINPKTIFITMLKEYEGWF